MVRCAILLAVLLLAGCDGMEPVTDAGAALDASGSDAGVAQDAGPGLLYEIDLVGAAGAEVDMANGRLVIGGETVTCAYLAGEEPVIPKSYRMHFRIGDGPEIFPGAESWMPQDMLCQNHTQPWNTSGTRYALEGEQLSNLCDSGAPLVVTLDLIERVSSELLGQLEVYHSAEFVADYCTQLGL